MSKMLNRNPDFMKPVFRVIERSNTKIKNSISYRASFFLKMIGLQHLMEKATIDVDKHLAIIPIQENINLLIKPQTFNYKSEMSEGDSVEWYFLCKFVFEYDGKTYTSPMTFQSGETVVNDITIDIETIVAEDFVKMWNILLNQLPDNIVLEQNHVEALVGDSV